MSSADSRGHSTSKANSVLIIDLDETLLSINSFRVWADYFLFGNFASLSFNEHYKLAVDAAIILMKRKVLKRSHAQTKADLHKLWAKTNDEKALEKMMLSLEKKIRPNMLGVLEKIKTNKIDAVLSTAAASAYADPFAMKIGFKHVISTKLGEKENRSEEKAKNSLTFLEKQGWSDRKKIFFTDHLEDMPLMLKSDKVMWFGKAEEMETIREAAKNDAPNLEIVRCGNMYLEEMTDEINK